MSTVPFEDFGRDASGLLDRVAAGETVIVIRAGRAVAELRPLAKPLQSSRPFGLCAGAFQVPDDFDALLPADESYETSLPHNSR